MISPKITIIGGGIGGLTTALALEHFGITNYHVYEQAEEFREIGAAVSLWPNALRVYKELGLLNDLKPHWGELKTAYLKNDDGTILSKTQTNYELPTVCIHRAHLHHVLFKNLPQEKLTSKYKLSEIKKESGSVQLKFDNGNIINSEIVIGADGINSIVRKHLKNDGSPTYRGYKVWRGIADLKDEPQNYASETWGKGSRIGIVPVHEGKFGWWATINVPENEAPVTDRRKRLKEHFETWHSPIPLLFDNSPEILENKIGDRVPTKGWHNENMVLLGDAAHPTTPNLGQGACMAIEGAYLLSKCLKNYNSHTDAFKRYEELHFPRAKDIVSQSLKMGKIGQLENSLAIAIRTTIMKLTPDKMAMKLLDKYFGHDVTRLEVNRS